MTVFSIPKSLLTKALIALLFFSTAALAYAEIEQYWSESKASLHDNSKSLFNLQSHWDSGNIAVLIRHTERCDRSDNACLSGQDGITVPGAHQANELKETYSELVSEDTQIYNSPVKRTDQTADIIFSDKSQDHKALRENCKEDIYKDILALKEKQKNLILVTHSTCIDNLGETQQNKLFDFNVHDTGTYGGSFFLSVDSDNQEIHALGYLALNEVEQLLEFIN